MEKGGPESDATAQDRKRPTPLSTRTRGEGQNDETWAAISSRQTMTSRRVSTKRKQTRIHFGVACAQSRGAGCHWLERTLNGVFHFEGNSACLAGALLPLPLPLSALLSSSSSPSPRRTSNSHRQSEPRLRRLLSVLLSFLNSFSSLRVVPLLSTRYSHPCHSFRQTALYIQRPQPSP